MATKRSIPQVSRLNLILIAFCLLLFSCQNPVDISGERAGEQTPSSEGDPVAGALPPTGAPPTDNPPAPLPVPCTGPICVGGFYDINTDLAPKHVNPLTGLATCPAGLTPFVVSVFDAAGFYGTTDGILYSCHKEGMGGLFSTSTNGRCEYPNPATGACSCPETLQTVLVSAFDAAGSYATSDGFLFYCYANGSAGMFDTNTNDVCMHPNPATGACSCGSKQATVISEFDAAGAYSTRDGKLYLCH